MAREKENPFSLVKETEKTMKFGYFDDQKKEYVITTPQTPHPWINYLGCENLFGIISNTGGGFCFYKDARLRRILRYRYNQVPLDSNGRYFYLKDERTVWSASWQPVRAPLDFYECRHGLGYTRITSIKNGVKAETLFFIPLGENCEIHFLRLTNLTSVPRNLKVFSFLEFCLWNALEDMTNFQRNLNTAEVEVEGSVIYHKTEYRERRNHYAFYAVNHPLIGFDTDRDSFVGLYNGLDRPQVVLEGKPHNSIASGWSPVASHCLEVFLGPAESQDFIFILGYVENEPGKKWEKPGIINKEKARAMVDRFASSDRIEEAFHILQRYWENLLSSLVISSGDGRVDRMINIWNPYQCMVTFHLSRSASYFESGISRGIGFRDSNQDILGVVHMVPQKVRERILDLAATQCDDGSAYHQYQPLTKKGNLEIGSGFYDDPLWLVYSTLHYIKETGDWTILDVDVAFANDPQKRSPLWEHLRRALQFTLTHRGPHGLPLIGRADWNDCLNLNSFSTDPDESFQTCPLRTEGNVAESVFLAGMFVMVGSEYARLCRKLGKIEEAQDMEEAVAAMKEAVAQHGFDEEWFLRAYDAQGKKVGSKDNVEGKIYIEPQGFCVMAGIGLEDKKAEKALDAVYRYLNTTHGIKLLFPAYTRFVPELGEISSYPPGYKENGGIFCHNNPWVMIAETKLGRGDRAFEYYKKICPAFREEISDLHRLEPYVYAQVIASDESPRFGEAKNSWLTGTASWNYVAFTQYILGIRPDFDGLYIDPCLPSEIAKVTVWRKFRGVTYHITIENTGGGYYCLMVDGKVMAGKCVVPPRDRSVVEVYCRV